MMNGREEYIDNAILAMAWELADMLEAYSLDGMCSEEGLEIMAESFAEIEPELRADVFENFIDEIDKRGVEYDMTQFGADA